MGAWGLGIFQSDYDYDIISGLDNDAGLQRLEDEARAKAQAIGHPSARKDQEGGRDHIHFSVFADLCSDIEAVRKHLNGGILEQMFQQRKAKLSDGKDFFRPGYVLVILGACGMSLGCSLPVELRNYMKTNFKKVGLMRDALTQVRKALDEYEDGEEYDFGSKGLHETMESGGPPKEDRLYPNMFNVQSPGDILSVDAIGKIGNKMLDKVMAGEMDHAMDECGACGSKTAKGVSGALLLCSKCKKKRYCSRECQKEHWKKHKLICKAPAEDGKENVGGA